MDTNFPFKSSHHFKKSNVTLDSVGLDIYKKKDETGWEEHSRNASEHGCLFFKYLET